MNLLAPFALLGLFGLALPIAAHLLGRERPKPIRFAATRFLSAHEPVVTQRRELRDRPLMLVRLLLLALFVLVLARPVISSDAAVAVLGEPHDAVILLDASGSMDLLVDGRSDRARALDRLDTLLDALPVGSTVGLQISDPRAPSLEPAALIDAAPRIRAAVDAWMTSSDAGPRPGAWSLAEALGPASAMLASAGDRPRVVYAIGDPTARGLGSLPETIGEAITVVPVPTRGSASEPAPPPPEHVGLRALDWEPALELDARAVRIRAVVHRYGGGEDTLELGAALEIDNREVARTTVQLPADSDATIEFTHTLDTTADTRATVLLLDRDDDPLPIDDRRHLWLSTAEAVDVLLINGDPSETRANDEIFFLATALGSSELAEGIEVRGLAVDQLEDRLRSDAGEALAGVDVLVLANVRALAPELAPLITARVEAGMGLWITVGDRVSATDYNARLGELLPLLLREAVYAGTAPGRTEARSEAIAPVQLSHPMFAGEVEVDLGATRTRRMFLLEPDPRRGADIAVAFSSGAPALITSAHGQGRVALLTTSIDRDWGDLPLRPGFVPLAVDTLTWLAGAGSHDRAATIGVGQPKQLAQPTAYAVSTATGETLPVAPARAGEPTRFDRTDAPGHYRARPRDDVNAEPERFVVVFEPAEADTSVVEVSHAQQRDDQSASVNVYEPRWRELALVVLLLLGLESLLRLRPTGGWVPTRNTD